jgi:hypothetical protein
MFNLNHVSLNAHVYMHVSGEEVCWASRLQYAKVSWVFLAPERSPVTKTEGGGFGAEAQPTSAAPSQQAGKARRQPRDSQSSVSRTPVPCRDQKSTRRGHHLSLECRSTAHRH